MRPSRMSASSVRGSSVLRGDVSNPMSSMANLMDVMLVFACGLLLALVANWNIDLGAVAQGQDGGDDAQGSASVQRVEGEMQEVQEGIDANDGSYESVGTVYRNEETGELYIVGQ